MKFFRWEGQPGQLVGFGLVERDIVYRVPDEHAEPCLSNADFKELKGREAGKEEDAVLVIPDVGFTPQGERGEPPPGSPENPVAVEAEQSSDEPAKAGAKGA